MGRFSVFSLMMFLVSMIMISHTSAYMFYVGGRNGWVPNPSESYNSWAERMRFSVNDTLVFIYSEGDSVYLVTKDDYNLCNISNPIEIYAGGYSEFKFERSGPFFFISGAPGNCEKGEKLIVVVLAVRHNRGGTTPAPPTSSPTSPPTSVPPAPSPASISPSSSPTPSSELAPSPLSLVGLPPLASSPGQSPPSSTFEPSPPAPPAPPNSDNTSGGSSGNETSPSTPGGSSHAPPSSSSWAALFIGAASMFLAILCSF